jgi:hypothetical protein
VKNQFYQVDYKIKKFFPLISYVNFISVIGLNLTSKLKIIIVLGWLNFLKIEFTIHARFKFIKVPKQFNFKYFKSLLIVFHIANMIVEVLFKSLIIKLMNLAFFSIKLKIQDQSFIVLILLKHFIILSCFIYLQN